MNKIMLSLVWFFFLRQRRLANLRVFLKDTVNVPQSYHEKERLFSVGWRQHFQLISSAMEGEGFSLCLASDNCCKHIRNTILVSAVCTCINYSNCMRLVDSCPLKCSGYCRSAEFCTYRWRHCSTTTEITWGLSQPVAFPPLQRLCLSLETIFIKYTPFLAPI